MKLQLPLSELSSSIHSQRKRLPQLFQSIQMQTFFGFKMNQQIKDLGLLSPRQSVKKLVLN